VLWPERAHRSDNPCWHNRPVKLARMSGRVQLHGEGRAAYGLGVIPTSVCVRTLQIRSSAWTSPPTNFCSRLRATRGSRTWERCPLNADFEEVRGVRGRPLISGPHPNVTHGRPSEASGFPVLWPERAHRSFNLCWHNRPVKLARMSGRVHLHGEGRAAYGLGVIPTSVCVRTLQVRSSAWTSPPTNSCLRLRATRGSRTWESCPLHADFEEVRGARGRPPGSGPHPNVTHGGRPKRQAARCSGPDRHTARVPRAGITGPVKLARMSGQVQLHQEGRAAYGLGVIRAAGESNLFSEFDEGGASPGAHT
jgi:hypothetical protein